MHILVVEDDKVEQKNAEKALNVLFPDSKIVFASNYNQASVWFDKVDLIITDLMFPDHEKAKTLKPNGLGIIVRAIEKKIPFVLCTLATHEEWGSYIKIVLNYLEKMAGVKIPVIADKNWNKAVLEAKKLL